MTAQHFQRIAIIGFGEVGAVLAQDLAAKGVDVSVFDQLISAEASREDILARARAANVCAQDCMADAVRDRELIVSAVTASVAVNAAREAAPLLHRGQM